MRRVVEALSFGRAEDDPEFRDSVARTSILSLRAVGALLATVPLLMLAAGLSVIPAPAEHEAGWRANLYLAVLGGVVLAIGFTSPGKRWPRLLTGTAIWSSAAVMVRSTAPVAAIVPWVEQHALGFITLVMFGAAAAVPLKPAHTLALGLSLDALYFFSSTRVSYHVFVLLLTALCTALTASIYRQRFRGYLAHKQALRTAEELREAQNRLLIASNAAVTGRVAAALSHELNSPIGALASAVETLARVADRMSGAKSDERERLKPLIAELYRSGRESTQRLRDIVARIQRFANLDRAEVQSANLNDIIGDVVAMVEAERGSGVRIHTDLHPIPNIICRPQQFSAVLSNLIANAADAAGDSGRVSVATRDDGSHIRIEIEDNGPGIPPEQLAALFDPAAFRLADGRMSAGHWSLFSSREVVREHGGDVDVSSLPGSTTVVVTLAAPQVRHAYSSTSSS
jgi:signal transduction histidine kinase